MTTALTDPENFWDRVFGDTFTDMLAALTTITENPEKGSSGLWSQLLTEMGNQLSVDLLGAASVAVNDYWNIDIVKSRHPKVFLLRDGKILLHSSLNYDWEFNSSAVVQHSPSLSRDEAAEYKNIHLDSLNAFLASRGITVEKLFILGRLQRLGVMGKVGLAKIAGQYGGDPLVRSKQGIAELTALIDLGSSELIHMVACTVPAHAQSTDVLPVIAAVTKI